MSALTPPAPRLRVVVDRADGARCGLREGDSVDIDGPRLVTHGRGFCPLALAAVIPLLTTRSTPLPTEHWLVRKPYLSCARADETVVLRIDVVEEEPCG